MTPTPTATDIERMRMDIAVWPAELRLRKAIEDGRHVLSNTERLCYRLAILNRNDIWREMLTKKQAAGKIVSLWEWRVANDSETDHGLRLENSGARPQLFLYGDVGSGGVTASDVQRQLESVRDDEPLDVRVFSYGGDLAESIAIHNLLKSRSGFTRGFVDSVAASGGSVALMGCHEVIMLRGSWLMIHGARVDLRRSVDVSELRDIADFVDERNEALFAIYRPRWKGSDDTLWSALSKELWLAADDAVVAGLADRVADTPAVAAHVDTRHTYYKCAPECLMISARASESTNLRSKLAELTIHRACLGN